MPQQKAKSISSGSYCIANTPNDAWANASLTNQLTFYFYHPDTRLIFCIICNALILNN